MLFWRRLPPNHLLVVCAGFVWHQLEPAIQVFLRKKAGWSRWLCWTSSFNLKLCELQVCLSLNMSQTWWTWCKFWSNPNWPTWTFCQPEPSVKPGATRNPMQTFISLTVTASDTQASHSNTGQCRAAAAGAAASSMPETRKGPGTASGRRGPVPRPILVSVTGISLSGWPGVRVTHWQAQAAAEPAWGQGPASGLRRSQAEPGLDLDS